MTETDSAMYEVERNHGLSVEQPPTEQELNTLSRVPDKLPPIIYLVALVELCERFAFYTCKNISQNYLRSSNGPNTSRSTATALNLMFTFLSYCMLGSSLAFAFFFLPLFFSSSHSKHEGLGTKYASYLTGCLQ